MAPAAGLAGGVLSALPMIGKIGGPIMGMLTTRAEAKQAEAIAERRAAIDIKSAEMVERAGVEEARIKKERMRRLIEQQKGIAAAGGIRLDVGAPLVIEAETRAEYAKDIGFGLERSRELAALYKSRAGLERYYGKIKKRRSRWDIITQGAGLLGSMGTDFDWF